MSRWHVEETIDRTLLVQTFARHSLSPWFRTVCCSCVACPVENMNPCKLAFFPPPSSSSFSFMSFFFLGSKRSHDLILRAAQPRMMRFIPTSISSKMPRPSGWYYEKVRILNGAWQDGEQDEATLGWVPESKRSKRRMIGPRRMNPGRRFYGARMLLSFWGHHPHPPRWNNKNR